MHHARARTPPFGSAGGRAPQDTSRHNPTISKKLSLLRSLPEGQLQPAPSHLPPTRFGPLPALGLGLALPVFPTAAMRTHWG